MGIFNALRSLWWTRPGAVRSNRKPQTAIRNSHRLRIEVLEARRLMAADLAPQVLLGSVYFEEATGDDSRADVIEVSFVGGAAGTTLNRLTINGDKLQNGLSEGDVFFDTAAGGLGAFRHGGLSITSANGFTVNSVAVVDGGSQIVFDLTGFDAGEKLVFSVDADEAQFVDGSDVDVNSLVEGAEFQRSLLVGEFKAPHYVDLTLTGRYWDAFDDEFAAATTATGLTLPLPNDRYALDHDFTDRTAGAVAHGAQIPLATLSGWVYHDRSDDGVFNRNAEQGIGGVTLELLKNGAATGITTTTSSSSATLGYYEFLDLSPGTYGVREVQPANWLDGKDTAGSHGGVAGNDRIDGAVLDYGDDAINYNFGELLPGSIRGRVHAHHAPDCDFDNPEILLEGVRIDLLDAQGNFIRFTLTDANGEYAFTALTPAIYQVREHQPTEYYDGGERVGTLGGDKHDVPGLYSIFTGINVGSDRHGIQYDFCERVGVNISGNVYHDRSNDGVFHRSTEQGIGGVVVKLLDAAGNDTGRRATTNSAGYYEFTNLAAGTYAVMEVHPSGWLDGIDAPGNLGGVAEVSPPGDLISQIAINWGQAGVEYNFGELLPGSISGRVHADRHEDCNFEDPDILLSGVRIDLLDGAGNVMSTTLTNAAGEYSFSGLRPGTYGIREHQPTDYYDGGERVGTLGGASHDVAGVFSIFTGIAVGSNQHGVQYDFCERVGVNISGNVYHDRSNDGVFHREREEGIGGVVLKLLDATGNDTGKRATTNSAGYYEFTNLAAGTYAMMEVHPSGWLDGIDTPGNLGGVAEVSPPGDLISQIAINWGQAGVEYNFGELLPGSISGRVHADRHEDCDFEDPDILLSGVRIDLLDASGNVIATTLTNADGEYAFSGLRPGTYGIREHQPTEYYDGGERIGSAGGAKHDVPGLYSIFTGIGIVSDLDAVQYDFCERVGVTLSGNVYHDRSNDGVFDRSTEQGIGGVVLQLLDAAGNDTGQRVTTNSAGYYAFTNLAAGTYAVMEVHPAGWLDGIDTPGNLGGVAEVSPPGDLISQIAINWGQTGVEYNFGELLPGSISGQVVVCPDADGGVEVPIPGVRVDLLDGSGNLLGSALTNANGEYHFANLRPGTYRVREHQPAQFFDDEAHLGSGGGTIVSSNLMSDIQVGSDVDLVDYDFCELPPATISGYVFLDGRPIGIEEGQTLTPHQIAAVRDGIRTPDDTPLADVVLELRQGVSGDPILVGQSLAGHYAGAANDPIRVVTNLDGFYQFTGLPAGTYAVVQIQPEGVIDNLDRPGTMGGFAVNPPGLFVGPGGSPSPAVQANIEQFRQQFGDNAIMRIPLPAGQHSQENNFSEVLTRFAPAVPPLEPPPPPEKPPVFGQPGVPFVPKLVLAPIPPAVPAPDIFGGSSQALGFTWHLSVVNAGWPRSMTPPNVRFQLTAAQIDVAGWTNVALHQARWTLATIDGNEVAVLREEVFGREHATPVTGDFNGDGVTDIGVFIDGQWFLDLNGNGLWDEGDLWAQLGSQDDLPVTGDWDADGKTDIGIYGPAWSRDPWAIDREPGLPDADNFPTRPPGKMKNMPPMADEAADGARLLKRTARGTSRADLIDHVFHYGAPNDVPVTGDWNGDGIRQIGVFRDGQWNLDLDGDGRFTEIDAVVAFGQAGDTPVVGDFDGDGIDEVGIFRAGQWLVDTNRNHELDAQDQVFELGGADDVPVVGDWNDDGIDDPGVYQPGAAEDRVARRAG